MRCARLCIGPCFGERIAKFALFAEAWVRLLCDSGRGWPKKRPNYRDIEKRRPHRYPSKSEPCEAESGQVLGRPPADSGPKFSTHLVDIMRAPSKSQPPTCTRAQDAFRNKGIASYGNANQHRANPDRPRPKLPEPKAIGPSVSVEVGPEFGRLGHFARNLPISARHLVNIDQDLANFVHWSNVSATFGTGGVTQLPGTHGAHLFQILPGGCILSATIRPHKAGNIVSRLAEHNKHHRRYPGVVWSAVVVEGGPSDKQPHWAELRRVRPMSANVDQIRRRNKGRNANLGRNIACPSKQYEFREARRYESSFQPRRYQSY